MRATIEPDQLSILLKPIDTAESLAVAVDKGSVHG